jgi:peptidoglycan/LPS O-acetylase OafA/YrhL
LNKTLSLYLDLVRLFAAIVVLLSHFAYTRLSGGEYLVIRDYRLGSDAVILFFVLSGYVIAYVTDQRDRSIKDYALNRLARLYSAVAPGLLITLVLDQIGRVLEPNLYDGWWYKDHHPVYRMVCNLFFVNELWFASIRPFSNGPYWSLGYEFWYYVLYGVAFYCAGYVRGVLIALIVLVIGPKIMLLFPVWLMGVWTYRFNKERTLPGAVGWICIVLPTAIYLWIKLGGIDVLARDLSMEVLGEDFVKRELKYSDEFLISYVYGALIAANFIGMNAIAPLLEKAFARFEKGIRFWAGLTFSIYLLHYPLLHFFGALYGGEASALSTQLLILASTLSAIVLIGAVTERKKHVARRVIAALFIWAEPRRATSL